MVTMKEIVSLFIEKNPEGAINVSNHNAHVKFNRSSKEYTYSFSSPHELAQKLNLIGYTEVMKRKGWKQLTCGCWTDEKENYKTCGNCGAIVNANGIEKEDPFSFLN